MIQYLLKVLNNFNDQYNTFSWGCNSEEINGANNLTFGYGYQNTLDIKLD